MTDALPPAELNFPSFVIMQTDNDLGDSTVFTLGGPNGALVKIDLKTGHVTLSPGMTPDEGAKAFWKAVEEVGGRRKCAP